MKSTMSSGLSAGSVGSGVVPVIRSEHLEGNAGSKSTSDEQESNGAKKKAIDIMRNHLNTRLTVLKSNKEDRCLNGDDFYQAYQEYEALTWLAKDESGYREQQQEYSYLFISSSSRDPYVFPNSGHFKIALSSELNNVIRAELIQASFPLVDPTVNTANYIVRFSINPNPPNPIVVNEVMIPVGSYLGADLAVEITRQMNQLLYEADLLAGTYIIDDETGFVVVPATGEMPAGVLQMYCNWIKPSQRFIFQIVDADKLPDPAARFGIHVEPRPPVEQQVPYRFMNDDLYDVLGINRILVEQEGAYDAPSDTYYLVNDGTSEIFNGLFGINNLSPDARYRRSVRSNQAADLRGNLAVILDIDPLNDNDTVRLRDDSGSGSLALTDYFGFILLRDPAGSTDRILELTNNTFPIRKYYREGRSRINSLTVTMRRPDGTIFNFGGVDYFIVVRITSTRTQPPKPMFTRGG